MIKKVISPDTFKFIKYDEHIITKELSFNHAIETHLSKEQLSHTIIHTPNIESIFNYHIRTEIDFNNEVENAIGNKFTQEIVHSFVSEDNKVGKALSYTISYKPTIETIFDYSFKKELTNPISAIGREKATYSFWFDKEDITFPHNILGFRVIQNYGDPYWIAELKLVGTDIPDKNEYIQIYLRDSQTKNDVLIFKGFIIEVNRDLKKDLNKVTVKAVTNGWFLVNQNVPKYLASTPKYWYDGYTYMPGWYYHNMRLNEAMMIWDILFYHHTTGEDWDGQVDYTPQTFHAVWSSSNPPLCDENYFYHFSGGDTKDDYGELCGIYPSRELWENISSYVQVEHNYNCWDGVDCNNNSGDDRKEWSWNDFETTKYDAITQMSVFCDRLFHFRMTSQDSRMQDLGSGVVYYPEGMLVAFWTPNSSANNNALEPFSVLLTTDASNDSSFLEAHKNQKESERSIPNIVKVRSQNPDWEDWYTTATYPQDWWDLVGEGKKPVIHYKIVEGLNTTTEVEDYAQEYYNRLREGNTKYRATFLSKVCNENGSVLLPGSRINFSNVQEHNTSEYRITKITHRKDGAKPTITEIEYCQVYDLGHPNVIESGILEDILDKREKQEEIGWREDTYPWLSNPRKSGVGSQTFTGVAEVVTDHGDGTYDVRMLNSSQKIVKIQAIE